MSPFSRNSLIVVCLLAASLAMLLKIQASSAKVPQHSANLEAVPHEIDSWKGTDIPIEQVVYEILETDDILSRMYHDESGYPVRLLIVFSQNNRDSFHPPEICYVGGGTQLMEKKTEALTLSDGSSLNTTKLSVKSDDYFSTIWYWFMVGDKTIANHYWQQFYMIKSIFGENITRGAMIRISVDTNDVLGKEKASQFVSSLMPYLDDIY